MLRRLSQPKAGTIRRFVTGVSCVLSLVAIQAAGSAAEWGTLSGQFVFEGVIPTAEKHSLDKDVEVCSKVHPTDESLLVDTDSRGVANVVVYLKLGRGDAAPPVHESYLKAADGDVRLTNHNCRFEPHITTVRTSQTLVLGNDDSVAHNTLFNGVFNDPFNLLIGSKQDVRRQLLKAESLPRAVSCPIHAWMKGYVVVQDHPYVAVSSKDGGFELQHLPVGSWTFQFWQEKAGYLKRLQLKDGALEDRKGAYDIVIKPGDNKLGAITLRAELFE